MSRSLPGTDDLLLLVTGRGSAIRFQRTDVAVYGGERGGGSKGSSWPGRELPPEPGRRSLGRGGGTFKRGGDELVGLVQIPMTPECGRGPE